MYNTVDMMLLSKTKINKIIILQHLKEKIFEHYDEKQLDKVAAFAASQPANFVKTP